MLRGMMKGLEIITGNFMFWHELENAKKFV